jgi:hypothetical protein
VETTFVSLIEARDGILVLLTAAKPMIATRSIIMLITLCHPKLKVMAAL